jgi:hypothetical protein
MLGEVSRQRQPLKADKMQQQTPLMEHKTDQPTKQPRQTNSLTA